MDVSQIVAVAVFVVVMITIMTEKLHRSLAAITGAMIVLALHVMPFDAAMEHIDFNTLGVLLGMMLFVSVVKLSGVFEFLAIKCARLAKGDPWKIMLLFVLLTAVLSAFLDNVTTVLLIGPMTLTVCKLLDVNPIPFFMTEILASNIGGTATLIGDPPNIMIGSAAGYSFFDFILYDAPAVAIILVAILGVFYALYGRKMNVDDEHKARIMELDEHAQIKNRRLLKQSVVMTALVVVGFMAHGALGLESCIIALGAAGIIMLISGESIEEALSNVEWTTLSFFAGLFVIVGALAETGVIGMLANGLIDATGGNVFITMLVLLIGSAVISSFLDNIPFVATMIPILLTMESTGMDVTPLWWAVSLGACLGGNGTLIGASANVVLSDISKKHGYEITFAKFFKTGFPIMLLTILIAGVYLVVRFPPA
ncbi:MAG: putative transporter [Eggerthella lenta]